MLAYSKFDLQTFSPLLMEKENFIKIRGKIKLYCERKIQIFLKCKIFDFAG